MTLWILAILAEVILKLSSRSCDSLLPLRTRYTGDLAFYFRLGLLLCLLLTWVTGRFQQSGSKYLNKNIRIQELRKPIAQGACEGGFVLCVPYSNQDICFEHGKDNLNLNQIAATYSKVYSSGRANVWRSVLARVWGTAGP